MFELSARLADRIREFAKLQGQRTMETGRPLVQLRADDHMGEVRTKVLLTNLIDAGLARRGDLPQEKVRQYEADAVVDTGAVTSVLPQHVADVLGLDSTYHSVAEMADGSRVTTDVVSPIGFEIQQRKTTDEALVLGDEVLIGQTILEKLDLRVDSRGQQLVPNPAHPDQPVLKIK